MLAVRLMMAVNDINLAWQCSKSYRQAQPGIMKHAQQGNLRYFIQIQCGHLHEALKLVKEVEQSPMFTRLISQDHHLRNDFQKLLEYAPGGAKNDWAKTTSPRSATRSLSITIKAPLAGRCLSVRGDMVDGVRR